jgi:hypothetical protein
MVEDAGAKRDRATERPVRITGVARTGVPDVNARSSEPIDPRETGRASRPGVESQDAQQQRNAEGTLPSTKPARMTGSPRRGTLSRFTSGSRSRYKNRR